jgi:hypothetical protein
MPEYYFLCIQFFSENYLHRLQTCLKLILHKQSSRDKFCVQECMETYYNPNYLYMK